MDVLLALGREEKKIFFFKNTDDMSTYLTNTVEGKEAKLIGYKFLFLCLLPILNVNNSPPRLSSGHQITNGALTVKRK